ncbi:MAG: ABC transporter permease [Pseudomonadota bacterium]
MNSAATLATSAGGRLGNTARGLVLPVLLVLAWVAVGALGLGNPQIFVPVSAVVHAAVETTRSGQLPDAVAATLLRALLGFAIGAALGFAAGLLLGLHGGSRRLFSPTLNALNQIALFAWIPLLGAWLGTGEAMKITLIALGAFFPMLLNTEAGCRNVPRPYLEVGRLLEFDRRTQIRSIVLPAAAPAMVAGLEIALASAWLGTIGAEYLIGTGYVNGHGDGLGVLLAASRELGRMDIVIVGILALALTGLALDRFTVWISRRLLAWQSH